MGLERNTVVLGASYRHAFEGQAYVEGYAVEPDSYGLPVPFSNLKQWNKEWYNFNYKDSRMYKQYKITTLQLVLLFDKVILHNADSHLNYAKLKNTGMIDIVSWEDDPALIGILDKDPSTMAYATFLKPIILDALVKDLTYSEKKEVASYGLRPRTFCSLLFDIAFSQVMNDARLQRKSHVLNVVRNMAKEHYFRNKQKWDEMLSTGAIDALTSVWIIRVEQLIGNLMSMLDLSVQENAVLVQNAFKIKGTNIRPQLQTTCGFRQVPEALQIVKLALGQEIGPFPMPASIDEVLNLKDKYAEELASLRSILNQFELYLREGNMNALKKIRQEIRLASSRLARAKTVARVGNWSMFLSLPMEIIEMLVSFPPVASLAASVFGGALAMGALADKKKNQWIQIVR